MSSPQAAQGESGPAPLLRDVYPDFSAELVSLLEADGCADLAICAYDLRIVAPCGCGDDFCQSFYVEPKPDGGYGPGRCNVPLIPEHGMIVLDVVHGRIMYVEVIDHPPLRKEADPGGAAPA